MYVNDRFPRGRAVVDWVSKQASLTKPDRVVWCDGSEPERRRLLDQAASNGTLIRLNQRRRPGCYLYRSHAGQAEGPEDLSYICTPHRDDAGPTNSWMAPEEAYRQLSSWFDGALRGRTLYVVPYLLGPPGSPFARIGVELTDSLCAVLGLGILTRMGRPALELLGESGDFHRSLHCTLDLGPGRRLVYHFPHDNTVWSAGSAAAATAPLSRGSFALRVASVWGRREGWLAEHMAVLALQSPEGETTYLAAAFPDGCGKSTLAMLRPPPALRGWRVFTVSDEVAWLRVAPDGRLWALNPESGYLGAPRGLGARSSPNAMAMVERDTIFSDVALTADGDVWWEEMESEPPETMVDWQGRPWRRGSGQTAAHPDSSFTAPLRNNPALSRSAEHPLGVPISAIIFGGRRGATVPLVCESYDWVHGVYLGATMGSEAPNPAGVGSGVVRRDPMAMLPFCGYNLGDYLNHWLAIGRRLRRAPRTFMVNWFRRDANGRLLWPGYGDNLRVLKWIVERVRGRVAARETAVGLLPYPADLGLGGLDLSAAQVAELLAVRPSEWLAELGLQEQFLAAIGETLPAELEVQLETVRTSIELSREEHDPWTRAKRIG